MHTCKRGERKEQSAHELVITEWTKWLSPVKWQVFGHLTFPWKVRAETADGLMMKLLRNLTNTWHARIGAAWVKETTSKSEVWVGHHFHFVMTALQTIDPENVADEWRRLMRRRRGKKFGGSGEADDDVAEVEVFDPRKLGLSYLLKMADNLSAEIDEHNLAFFHPELMLPQPLSRQDRRLARRWEDQKLRASRREEQEQRATCI